QALLFEHPACLGAGVVEFTGLTNDDWPGSDYQNRLNIGALWHQAWAPFERLAIMRSIKRSNRCEPSCGPAAASGCYCTENAGRSRAARPSTTSSFKPM